LPITIGNLPIQTKRGQALWQRLGANEILEITVFGHWSTPWAITAARFLRHFSKGNGDYLQTQEKLFKGMRLDQIYKKAREHYSRK